DCTWTGIYSSLPKPCQTLTETKPPTIAWGRFSHATVLNSRIRCHLATDSVARKRKDCDAKRSFKARMNYTVTAENAVRLKFSDVRHIARQQALYEQKNRPARSPHCSLNHFSTGTHSTNDGFYRRIANRADYRLTNTSAYFRLLARSGPRAMSRLSPLSTVERKS